MCTSKNLFFYLVLLHSRCAANRRFSSKDSLKVLGNILLELANGAGEGKTPDPLELVNVCLSPAAPPARRSARNNSTPHMHMPCVRGITGKTPGKGSNLLNLPEEFIERCIT